MTTDPLALSLFDQSKGLPLNTDLALGGGGPVNLAPLALPSNPLMGGTTRTPVPAAPETQEPKAPPTFQGGIPIQRFLNEGNPASGLSVPPIDNKPTGFGTKGFTGEELDSVLMGLAAGITQPAADSGEFLRNMGTNMLAGFITGRQRAKMKAASQRQQHFDNQIQLLELASKFEKDPDKTGQIIQYIADWKNGKRTDKEMEHFTKLIASGGTKVTVENQSPIDDSGSKGIAAEMSKADLELVRDRADLGRSAIGLITEFRHQQPHVKSGALGETRLGMAKVAQLLGLEDMVSSIEAIDIGSPDAAEALDSISKTLAQRSFESQKGNLNREEFRFAITSFARLGATPEGNKLLMDFLYARSLLDMRKYQFVKDVWWTDPEVAKRGGSIAGTKNVNGDTFDQAWRRHAGRNKNLWDSEGLPMKIIADTPTVDLGPYERRLGTLADLKKEGRLTTPGVPTLGPVDVRRATDSLKHSRETADDVLTDEMVLQYADPANREMFRELPPEAQKEVANRAKRMMGQR